MLQRLLGVVVTSVVFGVLVSPAGGQAKDPRDFSETNCGFRLYLPTGWKNIPRKDNMYQWIFESVSPDPAPSLLIEGVKDTAWSPSKEVFGVALVTVANAMCIDCGDNLEWVESFAHPPMLGGYSIYRVPRGFYIRGDQPLPAGYVVRFVQYANSDIRGLVQGGYSYALMRFWTPMSQLRRMLPMIMEIARSFQFIEPARDCWNRKGAE